MKRARREQEEGKTRARRDQEEGKEIARITQKDSKRRANTKAIREPERGQKGRAKK